MCKGMKHVVVVVLDQALLDPETWFGTVLEYHVGKARRVDFSTTQQIAANMGQLVEILRV